MLCTNQRELYAVNKAVYSLLRYGAKVKDDNDDIRTVNFIDWAQAGNNDFGIAEEVTVSGDVMEKRPDLVVYVNGIALDDNRTQTEQHIRCQRHTAEHRQSARRFYSAVFLYGTIHFRGQHK